MTSTEQKHFDDRAHGYETEIGQEYPQALKWELIKKYSKAGQMVLDIGGANGRHALDMANQSRKVTCIDLSPGMLTHMRAREGYNTLDPMFRPSPVVARAQELPIASNTTDMAYCYATLLLMPDQHKAISELVRVVKPGGYIIVDIARPWNFGWLYWKRHYQQLGFPGIFPLSSTKTRKLFRQLKCHTVEVIGTGLLTQLLYVPFVDKKTKLREWIHAHDQSPDLDGKVTAKLPIFANREYIVLQKEAAD